jgi:hypothetical protein
MFFKKSPQVKFFKALVEPICGEPYWQTIIADDMDNAEKVFNRLDFWDFANKDNLKLLCSRPEHRFIKGVFCKLQTTTAITGMSLINSVNENGLFARKIWGLLYPIFIKQIGTNDICHMDLDSFLVDLKLFERKLDKNENQFYWRCNGSCTDISEYKENDDSYLITVRNKFIIVQ